MSYTPYKKIKFFSKVFAGLLKANLNKKHIPFMLELQVTRACNLSCDYCYADLENLYDKDYSLQDIKDIIDEFHSMGTRVVRLLGGEPLARKDIGEIIRYLRSKDIFIGPPPKIGSSDAHLKQGISRKKLTGVLRQV